MKKALLLFAVLLPALSCIAQEAPMVIAHRGGALIGNENSISAFENGIAAGADMVELDLHLTSDGRLVVCHDETLDRTTDTKGRIEEMTYEQVAAARILDRETGAVTDECVPSFEEVLAAVGGRCGILIEIKKTRRGQYPDIERKTLDAVNAFGMHDNVILQSFNDSVIEKVHELDPSMRVEKLIFCRLPFGLCFDGGIRRFSFRKYDYVNAINPMGALIGRRFIRKCHEHGKAVRIWTVNDPKKFIDGADAVITNRPDLF